jgi:hypothetical protein
MHNLYLIYEILISGFADIILNIFAILAIYFGISVIINNNPVISILYLIGLIASIASYLISEGFCFLGLSYLIIYIGAVYHVLKDSFLASALLVLYIFFNNWFYIDFLWFIEAHSAFINHSSILSVRGRPLGSKKYVFFTSVQEAAILSHLPSLDFIRTYSTNREISSDDFYEWLAGFTDAEGSFRIKNDTRRPNTPFMFEFIINLHKDDRQVLEYIKSILGIGNVTERGNVATLSVSRRIEVQILINIFIKFSLNTTKRLDFKDWKLAFELWSLVEEDGDRIVCITRIKKIKAGMNRGRPYEVSKLEDIRITKYWLLGFIEGEAAFSITKSTLANRFSLGQVSRERPLLEKICDFLDWTKKLTGKPALAIADKKEKEEYINQKAYCELYCSNQEFLRNVLVPLFSNLNWLTKKFLDFEDWREVLNLKDKGYHLIPEGKDIILKIIAQMNNNRLSTNIVEGESIDRVQLYKDIRNLLAVESDAKAKKSLDLLDEKEVLLKSFPSVYSCAKFLGINRYRVNQSLKLNKLLMVEGRVYYVRER